MTVCARAEVAAPSRCRLAATKPQASPHSSRISVRPSRGAAGDNTDAAKAFRTVSEHFFMVDGIVSERF